MPFFYKKTIPLSMTSGDIDYLFEMCKNSSYVKGNADYKKKSENTEIIYEGSNNTINAYAQCVDETPDHNKFEIHMFNGLSNATIFISLALAEFQLHNDYSRLREICQWIGTTALERDFEFSYETLDEGIEKFGFLTDGIIAIEAKGFAAGGTLAVIAHEQGHICLSHVIREDRSDVITRINERQADLFSNGVTATTPFESHILLGSLFVEILLSWMGDDNSIPTTHPHGRERVYNNVRSNDVVLKEFGITVDNVHEFMRPI